MKTSVKVVWVPRGSPKVAKATFILAVVFAIIFLAMLTLFTLEVAGGTSWEWARLIPINNLFLVVFLGSLMLSGIAFALHGLNSPYRVHKYEQLVLEDGTEIDLSSLPNPDLLNLISAASKIVSDRQYL